tara:strand:- start:383 stop:1252 length:870 start_codon:yes stop_codon:yes gene_type:complete
MNIIFNNQWYVLYLAGIMIASAYVQCNGLIYPLLNKLTVFVPSKRLFVVATSAVAGILPIAGRVSVSAGILDTIAPKDDRRKHYGILDYLSTHHYYLWSPFEKSVIIPMAVLSLSYAEFMQLMWPLTVIAIVIPFVLIFTLLKEDDVIVQTQKQAFANVEWVNWQLLVTVAILIMLGNYAREHTDTIKTYLEDNNLSIVSGAWIGFAASFLLGSSSRFAAFTAILASIFGVEYLPLFFAVDYTGYMLSPTHKCFAIGKMYFNTSLVTYYTHIILLCSFIITVAILLISF